jgi:tetratricopeptide (TPR) repeat protein
MASESDVATLHDPMDDADIDAGETIHTPIPPPPRSSVRPPGAPPPLPTPPPIPRAGVVVVPPRINPMRVPSVGAKPPDLPRVTPPSVPIVQPGRNTGPVVAIPAPSVTMPMARVAVPAGMDDDLPEDRRARRPSSAPPPPPGHERAKRSSVPPLPSNAAVFGSHTSDVVLGPPPADLGALGEGSIEVSTGTPNIVVDQPLEAHLDSPTVVDRALGELGDAGSEKRAEQMMRELEATTEPAAAAFIAYELGELYERRLADEARAVKAYGRSLSLDSSLRPNLWAIRRVFYRRGLWPNLVKLIGAEVSYARDDLERADLLLEKARVAGHHLGDLGEARAALDEAVRIAPQHQGALLELERIVARAGDVPAMLDVWERLAEAVEQPVRKISYWLEVARLAAPREYARAQTALEQAAGQSSGDLTVAERVSRERLRLAEEHGAASDIAIAVEELATLLLATFGPAGDPSASGTNLPAATDERPDRATAIRRELVALRRRQAQLARSETPDKAWDILQQAIAMSPGEPVVLADLTELAEELGRYDDLAELVQSWQAVEGDPGRAMALSIRRADALLRGGQRDQARALLASLEAAAPGFIVLTSAAERDALGRANAGDLARTYLAAANAALLGSWLGPGQPPLPDPGAAAALYVQAAELLAYEVGGTEAIDEARSALGKALEAVPTYPAALEALTELDDTTGNVAEALARLKTLAANSVGDTQRAHHDRAIRLARAHGDLEAVLELERIVADNAPGDLSLRWRLESTLAQLGRDEDRAQLLTELAGAETDATRRGTALLAAARLRERAGAVETATELYRQVLVLWPDDTFARESLVDLLRAQERWTDLVSERRAEARGLPDGGGARRALREAAWVLEVRLGDAASAAAVYDDWLARLPSDRTALEGAARCRAQFGDRLGEVTARRAIVDLERVHHSREPTAESLWLLGRALERAGQFDEAADVFRSLAVRDDASVAATAAALALADLAAGRADTVMRVEATAALAGRTIEPRLGAALAEDSGWMYALVLEDFERASQSFGAATTLEPRRRGALLGAALVAARRGDPAALSVAYDGLAAALEMPEAAAALHLRAAASAAAAGDLELANHRVAAARLAGPDDTSALFVLAETMPPPVVEASQIQAGDEAIADIVNPLLARAEVLEMRSALADDPAARTSWELDRAEALELAGRLREACTVVAATLKARPGDVRGLEAMRRMAKRAGDHVAWAQASYQLARQLGDANAKLALLRDAATVFDKSDQPPGASAKEDERSALSLAIYRRILQVDPGAPEHERLLDLFRERADVKGLISALTDRLTWLESEQQDLARDHQMVPLLLERATVLHGLGNQDAAMTDLDALLERSASHVEALRFRADLAVNAGDVELAIGMWRRCIAAETRPQRRHEVELQLSQVLAESGNDLAGAIENLERVVDASPDDIALHERLLGLCMRASDWDRAAKALRMLARLRTSSPDKAREELRLGLMLRDRMNDRTGARLALDRARTLDPLNIDVVRELSELLEPAARVQVLASTAGSFRLSIAQNAKSAVLYDRLQQVTGWQSDVDARWLALVGLEALGTPSPDQRQVLEAGRAQIKPPARLRLDESSRGAIRGNVRGALIDLWRTIAPAVQVATGVDAGKLGFVRGDRVPLKKLTDKYEPLVTALACFGIENVDLYISAARSGIARVLAAETPILCVGADVAAAQTSQQRWLLGRATAILAEGLATLPELRDTELGWTIVAALRAADAPVPPGLADEVAGEDLSIADRAKVLKKELSRKSKAALGQLAQTRGAELSDIARFRQEAMAVAHRAGLLWSGDLAVALAQLDVGKGGKSLLDSTPALDLTAWSVSSDHARLRALLGVALGGMR